MQEKLRKILIQAEKDKKYMKTPRISFGNYIGSVCWTEDNLDEENCGDLGHWIVNRPEGVCLGISSQKSPSIGHLEVRDGDDENSTRLVTCPLWRPELEPMLRSILKYYMDQE